MPKQDQGADVRVNPRTRRVQELILNTAVEILLASGAQEVTAARVAEEADVARTTIYRHWPDQRALLLAAIDAMTTPHQPTEANGPLAADVHGALLRLRTRLVSHDVVAVFGALSAYAAQDRAFGEAQRRFVEQLTAPTLEVLVAAQERGELTSTVDCSFEAELLVAPILHRYWALHETIDDQLIDEQVRRWLIIHSVA